MSPKITSEAVKIKKSFIALLIQVSFFEEKFFICKYFSHKHKNHATALVVRQIIIIFDILYT